MEVTVFKNIYSTTEPLFTDVLKIFKRIKEGNSKEVINLIRGAKNDEERSQIKKRLPSICFSGKFGEREAKSLLEHSGLICLDIDQINQEDLKEIKNKVIKDDYIFGCFVSPGGAGLKLIIKIVPDKVSHKPQFLALEQHFNNLLFKYTSTKKNEKTYKGEKSKIDTEQGDYLRVHVDKSGKDVNRVCFESWDPGLYWNDDSEQCCEMLEEKIEKIEKIEVDDYDLIIQKLQKWIDSKERYYKGNRNQFLYQFASALCRYGVNEMRVLSYLNKEYADYPLKELSTTVKGAYKANEFSCEQFTEKEKKSQLTTISVKDNKAVSEFWSINDKGRVKIDTRQFLEFIQINGFGIYRSVKGVGKWNFVFINNMIVEIVDVLDIKNHILSYVKKHAPEPVFDELQMKNRYFENTFLNALPLINVQQIRDKSDSCYIFFDDFYYEITKNGAVQHGYIDLKGLHIWKSQICKKTITKIIEYKHSDFCKFVWAAMGSNEEKYRATCAALGYAIHTYKKKRLAKLIYACDSNSGELDNLASGGTGKDLLFECLRFVRSVVLIDGKDFDKKDKFKFQTVGDDTQNVIIDDYEGGMKELFIKVTGHFEIEKKGLDKKPIPFSDAPKILVTSNSSPKGFSASYSRRLHLLEFSDHYNATNTPSDEFGDKDFFSDDWNQDDYNALYSFLFDCVKFYLEYGLKGIINTTDLQYKQFVKNAGAAFAEYFLGYNFGDVVNGPSLFNQYLVESGEEINVQKFYSNIRKMCGIYNWKYSASGRGANREIKIEK